MYTTVIDQNLTNKVQDNEVKANFKIPDHVITPDGFLYLKDDCYFVINKHDSKEKKYSKNIYNIRPDLIQFKNIIFNSKWPHKVVLVYIRFYRPDLHKIEHDYEVISNIFRILLEVGEVNLLYDLFGVCVSGYILGAKNSKTFKNEYLKEKQVLKHTAISYVIETISLEKLYSYCTKTNKILNHTSNVVVKSYNIGKYIGRGSFGIIGKKNDGTVVKFTSDFNSFIGELFINVFLRDHDDSLDPSVKSILDHIDERNIHANILNMKYFVRFVDVGSYMMSLNQMEKMLKNFLKSIHLLCSFGVMHNDITLNNILWNQHNECPNLIDFGSATFGDDSFLDLGDYLDKICTVTTRPKEYDKPDDMWKRSEITELYSAYYAFLIGIFPAWYQRDVIPSVYSYDFINKIKVNCPELYESLDFLEWIGSKKFDQQVLGNIHLEGVLSNAQNSKLCSPIRLNTLKSIMNNYISKSKTTWFSWLPSSTRISHRNDFLNYLVGFMVPSHDNSSILDICQEITLPPYIMSRMIELYDRISMGIDTKLYTDYKLIILFNNKEYIPVLTSSLASISLPCSKIKVKKLGYIDANPVYFIIQQICEDPSLLSCFLSPLTMYGMLLGEQIGKYHSSITDSFPVIRCVYSKDISKRNTFYPDITGENKENIIRLQQNGMKNFMNYYYGKLFRRIKDFEPLIIHPINMIEEYIQDHSYECDFGRRILEDYALTWF